MERKFARVVKKSTIVIVKPLHSKPRGGDIVVCMIVHICLHAGVAQKKVLKWCAPLYKKNIAGMLIIDIHRYM